MIQSKFIPLVLIWTINPLIEFVSINKLAEAVAACLGLANLTLSILVEAIFYHLFLTRSEILPRRASNGVIMNTVLTKFKFFFLIFSCWNIIILLPDNNIALEAKKRDMTKINLTLFLVELMIDELLLNN